MIARRRVVNRTGRGALHGGFTLLEVALTMTVLVILASVFWPNVMALKRGADLSAAVDDFRGLLVGLRVRAMEEGVSYVLTMQPETQTYQVSTSASGAVASTAPATGLAQRVSFDSEDLLGAHSLPEGLIFVATGPAPSEDGSDRSEGQTGAVIEFRPDGSASAGMGGGETRIAIVDDSGTGVEFQIRRLTGAVTVTDPARMRGGANGRGAPGGVR